MLPSDGHVHSEWSWDAMHGSMERTCERAVQLGLPSLAFTEHLDHGSWNVAPDVLARLPADNPVVRFADEQGQVTLPPFDVEGYFESLERCRARFPSLRVLSGLELGEPHRYGEAVGVVLASAEFDRVLGSLHSLPHGDDFEEPGELFRHRDAEGVMREYLAEIALLVSDSDTFASLAHIDYPVRYWPDNREPFDPKQFEDEFRHALHATAQAGRDLEINTVVPLHFTILQWWRDEGGTAVTFGSDAHEPAELVRDFARAAEMAEAVGFRAASDPWQPWSRA